MSNLNKWRAGKTMTYTIKFQGWMKTGISNHSKTFLTRSEFMSKSWALGFMWACENWLWGLYEHSLYIWEEWRQVERPGRPEQEHGTVVPFSRLSVHVQRERDMLQVFKPAFLYFHSRLRNHHFTTWRIYLQWSTNIPFICYLSEFIWNL